MLAAPGSVLATVARTLAGPRRRRPSWTPSNLTAAERVHFVSGFSQPRCLETHGIQDSDYPLCVRPNNGLGSLNRPRQLERSMRALGHSRRVP
jgi:hypothetical protein